MEDKQITAEEFKELYIVYQIEAREEDVHEKLYTYEEKKALIRCGELIFIKDGQFKEDANIEEWTEILDRAAKERYGLNIDKYNLSPYLSDKLAALEKIAQVEEDIISDINGRYYIECPFTQRNEAKKLGALWDKNEKKWYFTNKDDAPVFAKWLGSKTISNGSQEINEEKRDDIYEKLKQGIEGIFNSEEYVNFLNTMATLPTYSVHNTMLIYLQCPTATLVTTYNNFESKYGHKVNKGEKSFQLLRPNFYTKSVEAAIKEIDRYIASSGESRIGRFIFKKDEKGYGIYLINGNGRRIIEGGLEKKQIREFLKTKVIGKEFTYPPFLAFNVFDISQTNPIMLKGKDGVEVPDPRSQKIVLDVIGSVKEGKIEDIKLLYESAAKISHVPITYEPADDGEYGYYHREKKLINITPTNAPTQALKTLIHEITHSRLHGTMEAASKKTREQRETEAESVAYVVCQHYGIDTSDYSFGYVAQWSNGKDIKVLEQCLATIQKEANTIIAAIDHELGLLIEKEKLVDKENKFETLEDAIVEFVSTLDIDVNSYSNKQDELIYHFNMWLDDIIMLNNDEYIIIESYEEVTFEAIHNAATKWSETPLEPNFLNNPIFAPYLNQSLESMIVEQTLEEPIIDQVPSHINQSTVATEEEIIEDINANPIVEDGSKSKEIIIEIAYSFSVGEHLNYLSIDVTDLGEGYEYQYSLYDQEYSLIDGGVFESELTVYKAAKQILEIHDLRHVETTIISYDNLQEKVGEAEQIEKSPVGYEEEKDVAYAFEEHYLKVSPSIIEGGYYYNLYTDDYQSVGAGFLDTNKRVDGAIQDILELYNFSNVQLIEVSYEELEDKVEAESNRNYMQLEIDKEENREIEETVRAYIQSIMDEKHMEIQIQEVRIYRDDPESETDLDIMFDYIGDVESNELYVLLKEANCRIKGMEVGITPLKVNALQERKEELISDEPKDIDLSKQSREQIEVEFFVCECLISPTIGQNFTNIKSFEEALEYYETLPTYGLGKGIGMCIIDGDKELKVKYPLEQYIDAVKPYFYHSNVLEAIEKMNNFYYGEQTKEMYWNKKKIDADLANVKVPGENIGIKIYQVKSEKTRDYGFMSHDELVNVFKRGLDKNNYNLVAETTLKTVKNMRTLLDTIYEVGNTTDQLQKFTLPDQIQRTISVSDVIGIMENEITKYYYVDDIGFKELEVFLQKETNQNQDKLFQKYITEYEIDPVIAITDLDSNITKREAQIIAGIHKNILPLPNTKEELNDYLKQGIEMAKDINKASKYVSVQVRFSENAAFKEGEIMSFNEANRRIEIQERAIENLRKEKGDDSYIGYDETALTIFFKNNKNDSETLVYNTRVDIGDGYQKNLLEFMQKTLIEKNNQISEVLETGVSHAREISSQEAIKYKKNEEYIKRCVELLNKTISEKDLSEKKEVGTKDLDKRKECSVEKER